MPPEEFGECERETTTLGLDLRTSNTTRMSPSMLLLPGQPPG